MQRRSYAGRREVTKRDGELIIGIAFFGHGRHALVRDMVLAVVLTLLASAGAAGLAGPEWPDIFPELLERDGFPSYPVIRLSMVVAVLFVAHPYLSLPMRKVGRRLMWAMAIAALVMSYGTVSAVLGAVALGAAAAATIHLVFGSGVGIPSKARILDGLRSIGLEATEVEYLDDIDSGPVLRLLVLALVVIVIGVIVTFAVPKLRAKVLPHIREGLSSVKESVTDPERLLRIAGGTLLQKLLFAMTLAAAVAAYGGSLGFGEATFVNSAVSLFVGLVPVPGGVGVGEAAITAGLVAVGVPEGPAVAAAISHRMATNYIPPVYGWYASRWLTDRDYL